MTELGEFSALSAHINQGVVEVVIDNPPVNLISRHL